MVGEDEPVGVEDDARAGAGALGALGDDRDDRRADRLGDVDDRAGSAGGRVGNGRSDDRGRDRRLVVAGGVDDEVRPARRQDGGADDGGEDEARADGALGARAGAGGRDRRAAPERGRRGRVRAGAGGGPGWRAARSRSGSTRPVVEWAGSCRASRPNRPARRGCRRSWIGSSAAPLQSPDAVAGRSYRLECGRAP